MTSFILTGVLLAGCGTSTESESIKVLSKDVRADTVVQESELKVMKSESLPISKAATYSGLAYEALYLNEDGATYRFDPMTKEKEKVADMEFYTISESGNKALANVKNKFFVLDLTTGQSKEIGQSGEQYEYYFADVAGEEVIHVKAEKQGYSVHLIDAETAKRTTWTLDDTFDFNGFTITGVRKGKESLYTALKNKDGEEGLYELRLDGEIQLITALKDIESLSTFDFLTDEKIIFNDLYKGKSGIYTFDLNTQEVVQLVAGGEDKEGIWVPFYLLSPDQTKMLFDVPVQVGDEYKTNVYVGELVGDQLTNITTVMTAADLYGVIPISARWSEDSQQVYIATNERPNDTIETIEVFQITK